MITPVDIQNKEFTKSVRGYKEEEVDAFLDLITLDMEKLLADNRAFRTEAERLQQELQKYRGSEGAVLDTLEAAKALMGDISASAEKRASILLKNAELDAQMITREAKESADRLTEENKALSNRFVSFRNRYKNLLESELARFDTLSAELFAEIKRDEAREDALAAEKKTVSRNAEMVDLRDTKANLSAVTEDARHEAAHEDAGLISENSQPETADLSKTVVFELK